MRVIKPSMKITGHSKDLTNKTDNDNRNPNSHSLCPAALCAL